MRILFLHILTVCLLFGCDSNEDRPYDDLGDIKYETKVNIDRLDQEQAVIDNEKQAKEFLKRNALFKKHFMDEVYPGDVQVKEILKLVQGKSEQQLLADVQRVFSDVSQIEDDFGKAFDRIKAYYPDFQIPIVQMAVTGFMKDFVILDNYILISPEFFPDDQSKFRHPQMPDYLLKRYKKENLVTIATFFLSQNFNEVDFEDRTLVRHMIAHGKALYFVKQIFPEKADSTIIGYSPKQMEFCLQFEEQIWDHFLNNQLVYSMDHNHEVKYIRESPKIPEIDNRCPGRIGQWLGWRIVEKYMKENPDVTLQSLMADVNAKEIFMQSKYRPKAPEQ